jgi:hypothetical protein
MHYMQLGANEFRIKRRHSGVDNAPKDSPQLGRADLFLTFITKQ